MKLVRQRSRRSGTTTGYGRAAPRAQIESLGQRVLAVGWVRATTSISLHLIAPAGFP
jgi:hypothetical protein